MTPFNAQAVVFSQSTFWGMLMPVTVHGRVTDIWRSYFTQRLMWDVGQRVAFCAPFVTQCRNPHNYLADFDGESDLYSRSGALVRRLLEWQPRSGSLAGRIEEMAILMYETGILHEDRDVQLYTAWLHDLVAIGYEFPSIDKNGFTPRATKTTAPVESSGICEHSAAVAAKATEGEANLNGGRS
jgi:hypothetical protein